jgi:putative transcriptional regulator
MGKMFELLKQGLEEAIEYHRGNIQLRTKEVYIPDAPKTYSAKEIKKLRERLNFSQKNFASWLNVSLNTVQSWEQGVRTPNHAALRLLEIFDKGFPAIEQICKVEHKVEKSKKKVPSFNSVEKGSKVAIAAKTRH